MDKGNYYKLKPVETLGMDICGVLDFKFPLRLVLDRVLFDLGSSCD